jgi:hypothetical protein
VFLTPVFLTQTRRDQPATPLRGNAFTIERSIALTDSPP